MKDKEIEAFESRHGYKPTPIRVAIDALAVYVHKDNPLDGLSIADVDAMFSTTRRCGGSASKDAWGSLGLTGGWTDRPIQLYGRNSVSGTYGYFKSSTVLGDFKNSVMEQPGSASVVQAVASSLNGIGYSGIGYITSGVKALDIPDGVTKHSCNPRKCFERRLSSIAISVRLREQKPGQPAATSAQEF